MGEEASANLYFGGESRGTCESTAWWINRVTSSPSACLLLLPQLSAVESEKDNGKCVCVYLFMRQIFIASHSMRQVGLQL